MNDNKYNRTIDNYYTINTYTNNQKMNKTQIEPNEEIEQKFDVNKTFQDTYDNRTNDINDLIINNNKNEDIDNIKIYNNFINNLKSKNNSEYNRRKKTIRIYHITSKRFI